MKFLYIIILLCICTLPACKKRHESGNNTQNPPPVPTPSSSKDITSFILKAVDNSVLFADTAGLITEDTIIIFVRYGTNVTALKPTIVQTGVSISPQSGSNMNFTSPVQYIVTAPDSSKKEYVAIVKFYFANTVYIGGEDGEFYALDADRGFLKWSFTTRGAISYATPAYYNGTVIIGSSDGYLYALNAATGSLKWKYSSKGSMDYSFPVVYKNMILIRGIISQNYKDFYGIDTLGNLIWESPAPYGNGDATVANGIGYVNAIFGNLFSFDPLTGKAILSYPKSNTLNSKPLVANSIIYTGGETSVVSAFNIATGALIWQYFDVPPGQPTSGSAGSPSIHNGTIFNSAYNNYLYAIDSATGILKWKFKEYGGTLLNPSVGNGIVYISSSSDSYIYAVKETSGNLIWQYGERNQTASNGNVTLKNNMLFVGRYDHYVYAFDAISGTVRWKYATGAAVTSAACVVSDDGSVYYPGAGQ